MGVSPRPCPHCLRASPLLCGHGHPTGWHLTGPPGTDGETETRRREGPVPTIAGPTGHPPRGAGREQSGLTAKTPAPRPSKGEQVPFCSQHSGGTSRAVPAPFLTRMSSWVGRREGGLSRGAQGQGNEGVLDCGWLSAEPRAALRPEDGWGGPAHPGSLVAARAPRGTHPASTTATGALPEGGT